jgi:hypothetical protein
MFNNVSMLEDALRYQALLAGCPAAESIAANSLT